MLNCPQGDGMKHYHAHVNDCVLHVWALFSNPCKHRLADVEDKVLCFLLCSHVGHINGQQNK